MVQGGLKQVIPPTARITPLQPPANPSSRPRMVWLSSPCCNPDNSVDITLPTQPRLPALKSQPNSHSSSKEAPSHDPQQNTPSFGRSEVVTPVSTTCIQPSQVTCVTRHLSRHPLKTEVVSSHRRCEHTHQSLPSANNAANLQKHTNIFKGVDGNPPASHNTALTPPL